MVRFSLEPININFVFPSKHTQNTTNTSHSHKNHCLQPGASVEGIPVDRRPSASAAGTSGRGGGEGGGCRDMHENMPHSGIITSVTSSFITAASMRIALIAPQAEILGK